MRAWELAGSGVEDSRGRVRVLRIFFGHGVEPPLEGGAHQPLIRIKAWERAFLLRAPDSLRQSQKIVGTRPCPRDETTIAWLTGPRASASTLWAHGVGAPSLFLLEKEGSEPPPFTLVGAS